MQLQTVSIVTIIGIIFTLLVSVGVPVALMILAAKKLKADKGAFLIGAGTFVVCALILEKLIFNGLVDLTVGLEKIQSNIAVYAIFAGLEAAVFEEVGRYLVMKFFMKKNLNKPNSVMFGVGHGGIEAILLAGTNSLGNLINVIGINTGLFTASLKLLDEQTAEQTVARLSVYWTTAPGLFFLAGFERIAAIMFHICMSYVVFRAVRDKKPLFLCIAILLHAFMDGMIVPLSIYTTTVVTEISLFAFVAVTAAVTVYFFIKDRSTAEHAETAPTEKISDEI